jgi:hypothetical protein
MAASCGLTVGQIAVNGDQKLAGLGREILLVMLGSVEGVEK